MLKIRAGHLHAFEVASLREFEGHAVKELRGLLPEQTRDRTDAELLNDVRQAIERGKKYELETEFEILCFAEAMLLLGQDFDTAPNRLPAQIILQSPELSSEERGEYLVDIARALSSSRV